MKNILDEILLKDNVKESFHDELKNKDFKSWIDKYLPEIIDCQGVKQDNPWHIYNCLNHILCSVEEMNKQTKNKQKNTRLKLAYTMFLHDIGKPSTLIRRYSKLYNREIDSFFNHNIESTKIAKRFLTDLNLNDADINEILILIEKHDIFMFITLQDDGNKFHKVLTKEYLDTLIDELSSVGNGQQLMKELVMVGKADNKSQNPTMTQNSLILLETMDEMLDKEISQNKIV